MEIMVKRYFKLTFIDSDSSIHTFYCKGRNQSDILNKEIKEIYENFDAPKFIEFVECDYLEFLQDLKEENR